MDIIVKYVLNGNNNNQHNIDNNDSKNSRLCLAWYTGHLIFL